MSRLGRQMFFARKRSANEAAAAPMLVTKVLSQDVMFLTSVPLSLSPRSRPVGTKINLYTRHTS
ncbi:hypothetical protein [Lysinibacillus agricola]|uniref:hypothetical protein n=1 Tax=Lysinibacillus agricola TaxID=2590012 RepID=UPI003C19F982